jgi:putative transposase
MQPFFINDVLLLKGHRYRLLKVVPKRLFQVEGSGGPPGTAPTASGAAGAGAYVISLQEPTPVPRFWELSTLQKAVVASLPETRDAEPTSGERPRADRMTDVAVRDLRWSRIRDIVDDDRIWEKHTRAVLLRNHAHAIGCREQTLMECVRMYLVGGQVIDALLGNFYRCGHIDEATEGAQVYRVKTEGGKEAVLFAPPKGGARGRCWGGKNRLRPFAMSSGVRRVVVRVACKHYLKDYSKSKASAATKVLAKLFCERGPDGKPLLDETGFVRLKPRGQRPSLKQVAYLLDKCIPKSVASASRHGVAEHENTHTAHPGSVLDDCLGAGDVFEIDSTLVDLWLVSRVNRAKIIGKATLYLVVDRRTGLIVGFYLSLENPSWSEAQHAILSVGGDWEGLCKRFGVPYNRMDWPAWMQLPNRYFADRADMMVGASEALTDGVRVQVTNAPPLMSSYKPMVEISFKLVHFPLRAFAPGYEPPENYRKRRGKKYAKDACLTFDELGAILLLAVWTHNTSIRQSYDATPAEAMSDELLTPVNLWNMETRQKMGVGPRMPVEVLRRKLLAKGTAVVKNDGIHFGHCIYYAEKLREWMVTASMAGSFGVHVSYTSNLVDSIIVWDPDDDRKSYTVELGPKSQAFKGWSFREVDQVFIRKRERKTEGREANQTQRVTAAVGIEAIAKPAIEATLAAAEGMPLGTRMAGAPELRAEEARQRRSDVHDLTKLHDPYGSSFVQGQSLPASLQEHEPQQQPQARVETVSAETADAPDAPYSTGLTVAPGLLDDLKRLLGEEEAHEA